LRPRTQKEKGGVGSELERSAFKTVKIAIHHTSTRASREAWPRAREPGQPTSALRGHASEESRRPEKIGAPLPEHHCASHAYAPEAAPTPLGRSAPQRTTLNSN